MLSKHRPTVFIGSSGDHKKLAAAIATRLQEDGASVKVWDEGVFSENRSYLDILFDVFRKRDFAVFIWASDDITQSKGLAQGSARDNVVLESGMALGMMGRERVFIIAEKGIKIPSDFSGINVATYDPDISRTEPLAAVRSACNDIIPKILKDPFPTISGRWKTKYLVAAAPEHDRIIEEVSITAVRGGILITSEGTSLSDPYSAFGRLYHENTIVGQWQNNHRGFNRGSFLLTINPRTEYMYGYATALDASGRLVYNPWLFANTKHHNTDGSVENATDIEIEKRFNDALKTFKSLRLR